MQEVIPENPSFSQIYILPYFENSFKLFFGIGSVLFIQVQIIMIDRGIQQCGQPVDEFMGIFSQIIVKKNNGFRFEIFFKNFNLAEIIQIMFFKITRIILQVKKTMKTSCKSIFHKPSVLRSDIIIVPAKNDNWRSVRENR